MRRENCKDRHPCNAEINTLTPPPWKRQCSGLRCNVSNNIRSLSLGAGILMTHTARTHHSQQPNRAVFFGPAIKNIIIRGRSISLKQISIPLYRKSLLSLTHTCTETSYSPAVQQNYFCVEAGTLQLIIIICWGQRDLLDT